MAKRISNCIRNWCASHEGTLVDGDDCGELRDLADRIDAEMVELPKGADGKPIHCGEELWADGSDGYKKRFLLLMRLDGDGRWALLFEGGTMCDPGIVTHEEPDSLERIADELEEWSEDNRVDGNAGIFSRAAYFAERIRRIAKESEE